MPPSHRRTDSTPPPTTTTQAPFNSRLLSSVRRNLAMPRRRDPLPPAPMYSTAAEAQPRFRYEPQAARPTIEQIAMGLHLSRTPHLRGGPKYPAPASHPQPSHKAVPLPPPPARSSMKKPPLASTSSTDVTSTSAPNSSDRSSVSLRARMSRFLPFPQRAIPPPSATPDSSPRTSTSELHQPRKKAVRFNTVHEEDAD
ncbi:hypothetical protein C8R45DRAFT_1031 [Mycena sanguinolenta]|nr:hypothetical protein C8R45DRAFT_1031 [Mycena sanguinolenta]